MLWILATKKEETKIFGHHLEYPQYLENLIEMLKNFPTKRLKEKFTCQNGFHYIDLQFENMALCV